VIRVVLPAHLKVLARVDGEVEVDAAPTANAIVDALEASHPTLHGTIRNPATGQRRPFMRYYACEEDWSFEPDAPLPDAVAQGREPFIVLGAMAGG
jgi:sulfur-carrier protein